MAETLGSLCDKLTIVKLKQYHTEDSKRLDSLTSQEQQLCEEIDTYVIAAVKGEIPPEKLTFSSNKIYKKEGNEILPKREISDQFFPNLRRFTVNYGMSRKKSTNSKK